MICRVRTLLVTPVLMACLAASPSLSAGQTETKTPARAGKAAAMQPNVLLITVDTLRADHVGCYGSHEVKTPTIDALCRDAMVFDRAIAQVPLTWPSHVAILTGTYPFWNGVQDFTGPPLRPGVATLPEAMKRHGYATGAVVSSFVLDRSWGLARGFDFYYDVFKGSAFLEKDIGLVDRKAGDSVDKTLQWMKQARRPFFFWLHLYDPHSPYDPPEPFRSAYRARPYDGEIAYADSQLARVFAWLKQSGMYDHTLIVLTSDHGESLGDHGEREHGYFIYDSTVRVPLVVKAPHASGLRAQREAAAVETIAIAPTILAMLGVRDDIQKQFQAESLLAPHDGQLAYSQTLYPFSSFGWSPLRSLENSQYLYIEAPEAELYDLHRDPGEEHNLIAQQPAIAAVMKEKLAAHMQRFAPPEIAKDSGSLSPDAAAKLRALGYLAYQAPVGAGQASGLADPKTKLAEFNAILSATDALRAGDLDRGQALLDQVRAEDPQMYLVPFLLGEAAMRRGDAPTGAAELRKALELNPNFDQAMTGLAKALLALGSGDEARGWLEKALRINPQNYRAWYQLAWVEMKQDPAKASAAFEKAIAIQPSFGFAHRDLGILQVHEENYTAGAEHLARAAELGLEEATLFNFLGIAYVHTNRVPAGIESYRRALQLDPRLAEAHLNLGAALQRAGRQAEARPEFESACRFQKDFCKYVPAH